MPQALYRGYYKLFNCRLMDESKFNLVPGQISFRKTQYACVERLEKFHTDDNFDNLIYVEFNLF